MASLLTVVNQFRSKGAYLDTSRGVLLVSSTGIDHAGSTYSPFREFLHPVTYIPLDNITTLLLPTSANCQLIPLQIVNTITPANDSRFPFNLSLYYFIIHPIPIHYTGKMGYTLIIDNYDSFTWNVYADIAVLGGNPLVKRNDKITIEEIQVRALLLHRPLGRLFPSSGRQAVPLYNTRPLRENE